MGKKITIEDHLKNKSQEIIDLFYKLDSKILELNKAEVKVTNPYIGYKLKIVDKRAKLFVETHVQNTKIGIHLRRGEYKNPSGITIKEAPDTHKWTLTKLVNVNSTSDLAAIMKLIEQSYETVK